MLAVILIQIRYVIKQNRKITESREKYGSQCLLM
jgi:hypothetical protein